MNKMTLAVGAGLLAIAATGAALAQRAGMMHGPMGNETMTRADAEAKAGEVFDRMDANHDGKLDRADRSARIGERFDRMDADHNGALTKAEFVAAHERPMAGAEGGRMGPGGGGMGRMHAGMRMMRGMGMMQGMDTDQDRAISRAEFLAGALKRFDAADGNHDGKLTPEERREAMKTRMGQMRRQGDGAMPPPR